MTTAKEENDKATELLVLMDKSGYNIVQENGQRKYGPPPGWKGAVPPKGSEVFVGKIPRDLFEDELVPVFEKIGKIYEIRLMMDFSGSNRGYGFVMYTNSHDAKRAIRELDNYEIRKSRFIGVCKSLDNCRLFVGGIPKTKAKGEIFEEMAKVTEGVVNVILYSSVTDKTKNRGFAFVEYENHRAAAMARRKLIPGKIHLWGHEIAVDWAEPEPEVDEDVMAKVTNLYVRNLMMTTTEDQIKEMFTLNDELKVEKVKKMKDYAFVHYRSKEDAMQGLATLNGKEVDGSIIEVTWAKPADKITKFRARQQNLVHGIQYAQSPFVYQQPAGYESPYGYPTPTTYASYASQPVVPSIGRGTIPGRIAIRGRGRSAAGIRGGRYTSFSPRSAGAYRKYDVHHYVELQPDMELVPCNPYTLKPSRSPCQILQELCQKNNWGEPDFQCCTVGNRHDQGNGNNDSLFLYKINIPAINTIFQPTKLCRTMEEAKQVAAEHVLSQLGVAIDSRGADSPVVPPTLAVAPSNGPSVQALPPNAAYSIPGHGRIGPAVGYFHPPLNQDFLISPHHYYMVNGKC